MDADVKEDNWSEIELKPCYIQLTNVSALTVDISSSNQMPVSNIKIESDRSSSLGCTENPSDNFTGQDNKNEEEYQDQKSEDDLKSKSKTGNYSQKQTCSICGSLFSCKRNVVRHMNNVHLKQIHKDKLKKNKKHLCSVCGALFSRNYSLVRHVKTIHSKPIGKDKLKASTSKIRSKAMEKSNKSLGRAGNTSENFTDQDIQVEEMDHDITTKDSVKTQSGDKNKNEKHTCSICGALFSFKGNVVRHINRVHLKEIHKDKLNRNKKHPCSVCGALLSRKYSLVRHVKTIHSRPIGKNKLKARKSKRCSNARKSEKMSKALDKFDNFMVWKYNMRCLVCKVVFKERSKFRQHVTEEEHCIQVYKINKNGLKYFHCPPCGWCRLEKTRHAVVYFMNHLVRTEKHGDMGCVNVPVETNGISIGAKGKANVIDEGNDRVMNKETEYAMYEQTDFATDKDSDSIMNIAISKVSNRTINTGNDNAANKRNSGNISECNMECNGKASNVSGKAISTRNYIATNMGSYSEMNWEVNSVIDTRSDIALNKTVDSLKNSRNDIDRAIDTFVNSRSDNTMNKIVDSSRNSRSDNVVNKTVDSSIASISDKAVEKTVDNSRNSRSDTAVDKTVDGSKDSGSDSAVEKAADIFMNSGNDIAVGKAVDSSMNSIYDRVDRAVDSSINSRSDNVMDQAVDSSMDAKSDNSVHKNSSSVLTIKSNCVLDIDDDNTNSSQISFTNETNERAKTGEYEKTMFSENHRDREEENENALHTENELSKTKSNGEFNKKSIIDNGMEGTTDNNINDSLNTEGGAQFCNDNKHAVISKNKTAFGIENRDIGNVSNHTETTRINLKGGWHCKICNKLIGTWKKNIAVEHVQIFHTEERTSKCLICSRYFKSDKALDMHVELKHTDKTAFPCPMCGKEFKNKGLVRAHEKRVHCERPIEAKYSCNVCKRRFYTSNKRFKHERIHRPTKNLMCEMCGKVFKYIEGLTAHKRRHSGIKSKDRCFVNCSVCDKKITKSCLSKHMMIHKERNISCNICNAKFVQKHHLKNHMVIHTGGRSFKCPICGYCFNLKHHLNSHLKTKHDILSKNLMK